MTMRKRNENDPFLNFVFALSATPHFYFLCILMDLVVLDDTSSSSSNTAAAGSASGGAAAMANGGGGGESATASKLPFTAGRSGVVLDDDAFLNGNGGGMGVMDRLVGAIIRAQAWCSEYSDVIIVVCLLAALVCFWRWMRLRARAPAVHKKDS
jgi:hypothetical protein